MKLQEVLDRVEEIRKETHGPSRHAEEDSLWEDVLRAVSRGECEDAPPAAFAGAALGTAEGRFDRWYE